MIERTYTVYCPFGGMGAGALGFAQAEVQLLGRVARFVVLGGIDFDEHACRDFELLTGVPELCRDVESVTPAELRQMHPRRPDCTVMSPPCKAASKLLNDKKAQEEKYKKMMRLAVSWTATMLEAWADDLPPLILFENVPNITTERRGKQVVEHVERLLRAAGYVTHRGFHDCGELGGLAQHRKRFLMIGRHPKKIPPLIYQPPKKRVRGCGEVLGELPLPEDVDAAGAMHVMPRIQWLNWLRLALIPPGGDWRDIPGVLEEGQARRLVFRRYRLEDWRSPCSTIGGAGSNGPYGVADPRAVEAARRTGKWYPGILGVSAWGDPAATVTSRSTPSTGRFAIADPRVAEALPVARERFHHSLKVTPWHAPSPTVTSSPAPSSGGVCVADPRVAEVLALSDNPDRFHANYAVRDWDQPAKTVTSASRPGSGAQAVADPRVHRRRFAGSLGVTLWDEPAATIAGESLPPNGKFSVADPRVSRAFDRGYAVLGWDQPSNTIAAGSAVGQGTYSVADVRVAGVAGGDELQVEDLRRAPDEPPVIIAADGTWHRPLTTLELAALQGLPTKINGSPLVLSGSGSTVWREQIGNAIPPPASKAIAEEMLVSLVHAEVESGFMRVGGMVWVDAPDAIEPGWVRLQ